MLGVKTVLDQRHLVGWGSCQGECGLMIKLPGLLGFWVCRYATEPAGPVLMLEANFFSFGSGSCLQLPRRCTAVKSFMGNGRRGPPGPKQKTSTSFLDVMPCASSLLRSNPSNGNREKWHLAHGAHFPAPTICAASSTGLCGHQACWGE